MEYTVLPLEISVKLIIFTKVRVKRIEMKHKWYFWALIILAVPFVVKFVMILVFCILMVFCSSKTEEILNIRYNGYEISVDEYYGAAFDRDELRVRVDGNTIFTERNVSPPYEVQNVRFENDSLYIGFASLASPPGYIPHEPNPSAIAVPLSGLSGKASKLEWDYERYPQLH